MIQLNMYDDLDSLLDKSFRYVMPEGTGQHIQFSLSFHGWPTQIKSFVDFV